jgi:DnaJ-class molecular chaperone
VPAVFNRFVGFAGSVYAIGGFGITSLANDPVVVVHVRVPRKLTAKQREAIEALRDAERPVAPKASDANEVGSRKRGGFWGKMKDSLGG